MDAPNFNIDPNQAASIFGPMQPVVNAISGWFIGLQSMDQLEIFGLLCIFSSILGIVVCVTVLLQKKQREMEEKRRWGRR